MRQALGRYWIQAALIAVAAVWGATFIVVKDENPACAADARFKVLVMTK